MGTYGAHFFHFLCQYEIVDPRLQLHWGNILDDVRRSIEFIECPRIIGWVSGVDFVR